MIDLDKARIVRSTDKKNWTYQEFREGGIDNRTGKKGPDKWFDVGYYGKLKDLVVYLVDRNIKVPEGTLIEQLKGILAEIKRVENSILTELEK